MYSKWYSYIGYLYTSRLGLGLQDHVPLFIIILSRRDWGKGIGEGYCRGGSKKKTVCLLPISSSPLKKQPIIKQIKYPTPLIYLKSKKKR
jgi:hypothetical protein